MSLSGDHMNRGPNLPRVSQSPPPPLPLALPGQKRWLGNGENGSNRGLGTPPRGPEDKAFG